MGSELKAMLCRIFGHKRDAGWWGDGLYGDVVAGALDGIHRQHYAVMNNCDRCGRRYVMARFSKKENPGNA